jgi:hypothetical protein
MKRLLVNCAALFILCHFSTDAVCIAQERKNQREASASVGFDCLSGKQNQPRPETRTHLGDVTKKALEFPEPQLPPQVARISGTVSAEVVIDLHSGEVVWAKMTNGHPLLQKAVMDVVCRVRFAHSFINSRPIRVRGIVTYKFGKPRRVTRRGRTVR